MRVIQIMAGAAHGGAETAFIDIVGAFERAKKAGTLDVEQKVIIRKNKERADLIRSFGIEPIELKFGNPFFDKKTARKIKKIIQEFKPDIVQTWMNRATKHCPYKEKTGENYVHVAWQGGYYDLKYYRAKVDELLVMTPDKYNSVLERGWAPEKLRIMRHFHPEGLDATPIDRSEFDTPNDVPLFIGLGRLHWKKGFDLLLEALKDIPKAHLWIAGEGELREELEEQIKMLGLEDRAKLIGWRDDREALLRTADFCAFPSRYEPFGIVMVEAWATKTPLIAAKSAGPAGHISHEKDGLLIEIDDLEALKSEMKRVIDNPKFAKELAENGYQTYQKEFTEEAVIKSYKEFYSEIL